MRVHHLNCGTMCPRAGPLVNALGRLVCHCLLVETEAGLVLVDTGWGTEDVRDPERRLGRGLPLLLRPALDPSETALRQIEGLGFRAQDVRHVIVTHLDPDHAGGLSDFPWATVHLLEDELRAVTSPRRPNEWLRYRKAQWAHGPRWRRYRPGGAPWFGFESVRDLEGLPPEVLLVPLVGHTRGHTGVAVDTGQGWLLHAGDAYFHERELRRGALGSTPGLALMQLLDDVDSRARLRNQERLRALARDHGGEVRIFCAHDPIELAASAPVEGLAPAGGSSR